MFATFELTILEIPGEISACFMLFLGALLSQKFSPGSLQLPLTCSLCRSRSILVSPEEYRRREVFIHDLHVLAKKGRDFRGVDQTVGLGEQQKTDAMVAREEVLQLFSVRYHYCPRAMIQS